MGSVEQVDVGVGAITDVSVDGDKLVNTVSKCVAPSINSNRLYSIKFRVCGDINRTTFTK